jgi:hypothetical protein
MNYDLAIMALEGLTRSPMSVRVVGQEVVIEGEQAGFKELARLCLLLGGSDVAGSDGFELQPGVHVAKGSSLLRLRVR